MSDEALMMAALFFFHGAAWLAVGMAVGRWIWGQ